MIHRANIGRKWKGWRDDPRHQLPASLAYCPPGDREDVAAADSGLGAEGDGRMRGDQMELTPRHCLVCGAEFMPCPIAPWKLLCGKRECQREHHNRICNRTRKVKERYCEHCGAPLMFTRARRWCSKPECREVAEKANGRWHPKVPRKTREPTGRICVDCHKPLYRTVDGEGISHEPWRRCTACQAKVNHKANGVAEGWEQVLSYGELCE